jgi:DNA-binding winged helix-turn-helix (wHTH) protein
LGHARTKADDGRAGASRPRHEYLFAGFRLDTRDERLWRGEAAIALKPRAFGVLSRLLAQPGCLVTKSELLADVWADVTVGEAVLKVCVREVRAALGDDPEVPRFIETVHGRGYRFIAPLDGRSRRSPSALVGRASELQALHEALREVTQGGGRAILVTGDAGIGKSALVNHFLRALEADGRASCLIARGHCAVHQGSREPYMPLLEALGRMFRAPAEAGFADLLERCAPSWVPQLKGPAETESWAHQLAHVGGGTLGKIMREMGDLIEALSEQRPVVLSVEDLHWSDRSTLDLLGYLARRRSAARLLLVGTSRLGATELPSRNAFAGFTPTAPIDWEELTLLPLSTAEVEEVLDARFGNADWVPAIAPRLQGLTGGNPLFLRSILSHLIQTKSAMFDSVRWVFEENSETWRLPRDLRAFIEQRFSLISAEAKGLLELASVIGPKFDPELLGVVSRTDAAAAMTECEAQVGRGFLDRAAGSGEHESGRLGSYRFAHPLYQQVLYEALPVGKRTLLHLQIAESLERSAEFRFVTSRLAHHYEQGEVHDKAAHYHVLAGQAADQRYAYHEAVDHLNRALAMLRQLPESPDRDARELQALLSIGQPLINTHGWTAPEVEKSYRRALKLCDGLGSAQRFAALAGLYKFFLARAHFDTAGEIARQCREAAEAIHSRPLSMTAHALSGFVLYFKGDLAGARHHLELSRSLHDFDECQPFGQIFGDDPSVGCLGFLGWVEVLSGNPEAGCALEQEAIALARRVGHPHVIATALALAVHPEAWRGNEPAVIKLTEELASISRNQSFALWNIVAKFFAAWLRCRAGDVSSLDALASALAEYDAFGTVLDRPSYAVLLGEASCRLDRPEFGLHVVETALAIPPRLPLWDAQLSRIVGMCKERQRPRGAGHRAVAVKTPRVH